MATLIGDLGATPLPAILHVVLERVLAQQSVTAAVRLSHPKSLHPHLFSRLLCTLQVCASLILIALVIHFILDLSYTRTLVFSSASHRMLHCRRPWNLTLVCLVFFVCYLIYHSHGEGDLHYLIDSLKGASASAAQLSCDVDMAQLSRLNLTSAFEYTRVEINVKYAAIAAFDPQGSGIADLEVSIPRPTLLNQTVQDGPHADSEELPELPQLPPPTCPESVISTLQFPRLPPRPDASHLIFGFATTLKRLNDSLDAISHWASGTNARLFALIEPASHLEAVEEKAAQLGINLHISISDVEYNDRYFSLVKFLSDNRNDRTQWIGILDDDTFFPSIGALISRLATYNHTQEHYIGGVSEDRKQVHVDGFMAFGGAGILLSLPLVDAMMPHYAACMGEKHLGDKRIAYCIYKHTHTKLTWEKGLHQCDMHGDSSGFYESGRQQPLSVHHYKSWFKFDMAKLPAVAAVCGDACLLRRWRLSGSDWYLSGSDWYLTNGFSLVRYSAPLAPGDLSMEKTWDGSSEEDYLHSLGPFRPKDQKKLSYMLEEALVQDSGVRQYYVNRPGGGALDRVLVVVWRPPRWRK